MDARRPIRAPLPNARRGLFHAPASTTSRAHPNPRTATSKPAVHIASETHSREDDLVERDASGNYKIMAPSTAMKMSVEKGMSQEEEDIEQEKQMIALYGRSKAREAWGDQAEEEDQYALEEEPIEDRETFEYACWGYWEVRDRVNQHRVVESVRNPDFKGRVGFWNKFEKKWIWPSVRVEPAFMRQLQKEREDIIKERAKITLGRVRRERADLAAAILEEVKGALQSSLERAAAILETDRWMFEGEGGRKM